MGPQSSELEVEKDSEEKVKGRDNGWQQSKDSYVNWAEMKCRALIYTQANSANSSPMYLLKLQNYEQHKY